MTLAQAAGALGLRVDTVRLQATRGKLATTLHTTPAGQRYRMVSNAEVERYRREQLGQSGKYKRTRKQTS